jgi:hypothetical protein
VLSKGTILYFVIVASLLLLSVIGAGYADGHR